MNRFKIAVLCLFLVAGCGGSAQSAGDGGAAGKETTFIYGARVIPGDGSAPIEEATMLIENGVITQLGQKGEVKMPRTAAQLDMTGKTLIPLLVNLQAYPGLGNAGNFGAENYKRDSLTADLKRYGYYGVGAVLSFGTDSDGLAVQVRDEQRAGAQMGATLFTSGRGIAPKSDWPNAALGNMPIRVSTDAEARAAVSDMADKKADVITMWVNEALPAAAYKAAIDEAHKRNLKIFADAPNLAQAKDLVASGVDGLVGSIVDREVDDALIASLKEKDILFAPALSALEARFVYADEPDWLGEQAMREVYPSQLSAFLGDPVVVNGFKRNPQLPAYRKEFAMASANLKKLSAAGVKIAFASASGSTDTFPGYFEHRELALMAQAGVPPADAIKSSFVSAQALGATDRGVLANGKRADFMILSANPLDDIRATRSIDKVYIGSELDRPGLIQGIEIVAPKITDEMRKQDAQAEARRREIEAEAKLPHYGKFVDGPLIPPASLGGVSMPTPKRSTNSIAQGNPTKITVTLSEASGNDLRDFYAARLAKLGWAAAGNCWERNHPTQPGKRARLCPEGSGRQIVLNLSVQ